MKKIFAFALLLGILAIPGWFAGPQLYADMRHGNWELAPDLRIRSTNCTRWSLIVSTCSVDFASMREPERAQSRLQYFVFFSWAGQRATLVRSKQDPSVVTTSLGIEHMRDRQMTFAVYAALGLFLMGAVAREIARGPRHGSIYQAANVARTSAGKRAACSSPRASRNVSKANHRPPLPQNCSDHQVAK